MTKPIIKYNGLPVMPSMYITDYRMKRRTFWERWFTRPWKPRERWRNVIEPKYMPIVGPDGPAYLCSYETYSRLYKSLDTPPQIV